MSFEHWVEAPITSHYIYALCIVPCVYIFPYFDTHYLHVEKFKGSSDERC